MRLSREEAAKNRERVVETASRLFREHGYDGIGIAALMQEAGLTNGAFYKQFDSKEALIAEATGAALDETRARWERALEKAEGDPADAIRQWYLTDAHAAARGRGCPYAALAVEAPRHDAALQGVFHDGYQRSLALLSAALAPDAPESARKDAMRLLSEMVGALALARAVGAGDLAAEILAASREGA